MKTVLVTGGGGFVGTALVRQLVEKGCLVHVAGRHEYPHVKEMGAICHVGDIADPKFCLSLGKGIDTVFHTAAKAGIWGAWQDYEKTNILGTKNIVSSCRENGIRRLVYTSTPSVVFDRKDIENGDENLPYAKRFLCHYPRSKVSAERLVLASNGDSLKTCAIRPHLIWGPGDPHLIPRLIERGRAEALKIVGTGENLVDITYIDNVAHAHLLAAESLAKEGIAAGQAYFIGQERPVKLWQWINDLYDCLGIPKIKKRISYRSAFLIGHLLEIGFTLCSVKKEPPMSRFLAEQLARSHYFSHRKAERDLGYRPVVTLEDGMNNLLNWIKSRK